MALGRFLKILAANRAGHLPFEIASGFAVRLEKRNRDALQKFDGKITARRRVGVAQLLVILAPRRERAFDESKIGQSKRVESPRGVLLSKRGIRGNP